MKLSKGLSKYAFVTLAAAGALSAWGLVTLGVHLERRPSIVSGILFVGVALAVTAWAIRGRRSLISSPIYLAFYSYVFFVGIGPLLAEVIDPSSIIGRHSSEPATWPLVVAWVGLAALVLGYWWGRPGPDANQSESAGERAPAGNLPFLLKGGLFLTLIGVGGILAYTTKIGGLGYLLTTSYGLRDNPSTYAGLYSMLRPGLFLLVAWAMTRTRLPLWACAVLLLYAAFDVLWFGPLNGARQFVITLVLTLACLRKYCGLGRRNVKDVLLLPGRWILAAAFLVALFWGALRLHSISELLSMESSDFNVVDATELATATAMYAPYEGFVGVVELTPKVVPYQWGATFYESLTVFIPRAWWQSKPSSFADWLAETLYGPNVPFNTVATWPGELYLNFGVIGVVLGLIAMGIICARLARLIRWCRATQPSGFQGLVYSVSFACPLVWMWGGSNPAVWYFLTDIGPVLAVILFADFFGDKHHLTCCSQL